MIHTKSVTKFFVVFSVLTLCLPLIVFAQKQEPRAHGAEARAAGLNIEALQSLDLAMQKQVDEQHVSGVIGLIGRDSKIGYHEAFGNRVVEKKTPMTKDTLFRIYSMTKPIVAVTAMSLFEEGKFKLDDPISNYLPEWKEATVRKGDETVPVETPVTARHLMTHSSGITYDKAGLAMGSGDSLEAFSQSMAKRPLSFQPGTNFQYSYSIDILGRYIEAIEGKPLNEVMRERVFDPLGMDDTEFWVRDKEDRNRVAWVYNQRKRGELKPAMLAVGVMTKPKRMMGGQGLMSTAGDYARFCQMLANKGELDGKRILKSETVELMTQNHLREIRKAYGLGGMADGKGSYYWGGAAGTKFWVDTNDKSFAVFMVQTWGYKPPTYSQFQKHAKTALRGE